MLHSKPSVVPLHLFRSPHHSTRLAKLMLPSIVDMLRIAEILLTASIAVRSEYAGTINYRRSIESPQMILSARAAGCWKYAHHSQVANLVSVGAQRAL